MRFISFPFHGLEQLVEYNRNSTAVKRFLPIYASRCTRYPHYESPPAKTRSFPQHCQCIGKRCFQQFIGGLKTWVATSSGDVFPAARTHQHEKNGISSAPIGDTDPRIQRKRFRRPKGRTHAKRSQSAFGNPGKTMREECPPSTSATPNPNGRRAEVENQIEQ